jgi:hypothetical protein
MIMILRQLWHPFFPLYHLENTIFWGFLRCVVKDGQNIIDLSSDVPLEDHKSLPQTIILEWQEVEVLFLNG